MRRLVATILLSVLAFNVNAYEFSYGTVGRIMVEDNGSVAAAIVPPSSNPNDFLAPNYNLPNPPCLFWVMSLPSMDTTKGKAIYSVISTAKALRKNVYVEFDVTASNPTFSACLIRRVAII